MHEYNWCALLKSHSLAYLSCRGTTPAALTPPYDIIVAADVVYRPDLFSLLISSFETLASPDTVIYLGFKERTTQDRDFFRLLSREFDYVMATRTNHLEHDVVVFRIQKKRRSYLFKSIGSESPLPKVWK